MGGLLPRSLPSPIPYTPDLCAEGGEVAHGRYPITPLLGSIVTTDVRLWGKCYSYHYGWRVDVQPAPLTLGPSDRGA